VDRVEPISSNSVDILTKKQFWEKYYKNSFPVRPYEPYTPQEYYYVEEEDEEGGNKDGENNEKKEEEEKMEEKENNSFEEKESDTKEVKDNLTGSADYIGDDDDDGDNDDGAYEDDTDPNYFELLKNAASPLFALIVVNDYQTRQAKKKKDQ